SVRNGRLSGVRRVRPGKRELVGGARAGDGEAARLDLEPPFVQAVPLRKRAAEPFLPRLAERLPGAGPGADPRPHGGVVRHGIVELHVEKIDVELASRPWNDLG